MFKLTIKTLDRRHWRCSAVFIVNFEHFSYLFLVFLLLTLDTYMLTGKEILIWRITSSEFQFFCNKLWKKELLDPNTCSKLTMKTLDEYTVQVNILKRHTRATSAIVVLVYFLTILNILTHFESAKLHARLLCVVTCIMCLHTWSACLFEELRAWCSCVLACCVLRFNLIIYFICGLLKTKTIVLQLKYGNF